MAVGAGCCLLALSWLTHQARSVRLAAFFAAWVALGAARVSQPAAPAWLAAEDPVLVRFQLLAGPPGGSAEVLLIGAWRGTPPTQPVPFQAGVATLHGPDAALRGAGRGTRVVTRARVRDTWRGAALVVARGAPLEIERWRPESRPVRWIRSLRRRVARGLGRMAPPAVQPLFSALVLADRTGLDPVVREHFSRTGTAHLLAISGLHVGSCMVLFWAIAAAALSWLPQRWTIGGAPHRIGALWGFGAAATWVAVAGAPMSGRRALVMAAVVATAAVLVRRVSPWNALAAAVLVVVWTDPHAVTDLGLQLSVVSVAGLIAWAGLWNGPPGGRLRWALRGLTTLFWTGVIGTLVTAPLVALTWGRVPLAGLWANAVAVPLLGAATVPPLLVGALLGAIEPALGAPFIWLASLPARAGLAAIAWLATPAWAPVVVWAPPPVAVATLYACVGGAAWWGRSR